MSSPLPQIHTNHNVVSIENVVQAAVELHKEETLESRRSIKLAVAALLLVALMYQRSRNVGFLEGVGQQ